MQFDFLGNTDLKVSKICLGTMTWGEQNTENQAHLQLDYALDHDINFVDTAELYAVPNSPKTYTLTERYIGTWLAKRNNRSKIVLASKIAGPRADVNYIRNGPRYNRNQITEALHASLKHLQTDYLDLYQLHWPERRTNFFGKLDYHHDPEDSWEDNILELLQIFQDFIDEGKIRYIGVSNETPWGTSRFLHLAAVHQLPRIVSIQNPYNLLNRSFEVGLAEMAIREKAGLLAYSPLAFGMLTGKYYNGARPKEGRITKYKAMSRYNGANAVRATERYTLLANDYGLTPTKMALAFVNSRPFLTSNIIGATNMDQLKENIESIDLVLSEEVLCEIEKIHRDIPNPAP